MNLEQINKNTLHGRLTEEELLGCTSYGSREYSSLMNALLLMAEKKFHISFRGATPILEIVPLEGGFYDLTLQKSTSPDELDTSSSMFCFSEIPKPVTELPKNQGSYSENSEDDDEAEEEIFSEEDSAEYEPEEDFTGNDPSEFAAENHILRIFGIQILQPEKREEYPDILVSCFRTLEDLADFARAAASLPPLPSYVYKVDGEFLLLMILENTPREDRQRCFYLVADYGELLSMKTSQAAMIMERFPPFLEKHALETLAKYNI